MYCGREREESEGCFFGFTYFHNPLKITEWQRVTPALVSTPELFSG